MIKLDPPIGVPRTYISGQRALVYPGEEAACEVEVERQGHVEFLVPFDGIWVVTPMPGPYGWLLRHLYVWRETLRERRNGHRTENRPPGADEGR